MRTKAYLFMKKFVLGFLKENPQLLEKYDISLKDISDLKNDKNSILEWVIGEYLDEGEFKTLGYTIESGWQEGTDIYRSVYHIKRKYVAISFKDGEYLSSPHSFEFVKPTKKRIIIHDFEVIPDNKMTIFMLHNKK